tara:strand:- start:306 stop:1022 length:717 start_codon:yes stop_codon:yes gene_type:complete
MVLKKNLIIHLFGNLGINYNVMTKLSILLCAHCPNEKYDNLIVKAISSIYEQSYKDYKLFIVLDQCWDGTLSKVKDVITPDTEIIIRNKKEGLARAKNAGLEKINTEYVAFLDADDEYLPGKLEKQMNFIENNNVDFLGTLASLKDVRSGVPKMIPGFSYVGQYETHEQIYDRIFQENVMTHGSMLIRKKALDELGGYNDVRGAEDWDLWKRAISAGYKFYQIQERLYMLTMGTSVAR